MSGQQLTDHNIGTGVCKKKKKKMQFSCISVVIVFSQSLHLKLNNSFNNYLDMSYELFT